MSEPSHFLTLFSGPESISTAGATIAAWRTIPARWPRLVDLPSDVDSELLQALDDRGIKSLYLHQAQAWAAAREGKHIVVATGTASGKTLCYNLPVLERLLRDQKARALYLFPTKALAHDQVATLKGFMSDLAIATYDGDTPTSRRTSIRSKARIVVSNPDMLHTGILPHHTLWTDFLAHLSYVVIDEMHVYRGVFGSHVANVLRRLKRVAEFYGSSPQFILTSATIGNPVELAERLVEESVTLVDNDGSARGAKHFVLYNPPVVNRALGIRRSAAQESVSVTQELVARQVQTIVFARSRQGVEQILRQLAPTKGGLPEQGGRIRGYRGGYLPNQRREIERGLREGAVRAVVATNALELGIDIGGMGAAVLVGYPGTIAGTMQQAGRAGRTMDESIAILILSADPMDQFLASHPDYLFVRSPEHALINPDNLLILLAHLRCAAFELPFGAGEGFGRVSPSKVAEFLEFFCGERLLHKSGTGPEVRYFWMADRYPADSVSLRSASADRVVLQNGDETIGEVDLESAYWMVHPQAIYLHEAQSFIVDSLDLQNKIAHLSPTDANYYTEPQSESTVQLLTTLAEAPVCGGLKAHGEIVVTTQVTGFRKERWLTHENLGNGLVSLPPTELHTTGYWLSLNAETVDALKELGLWSNAPNDYGPNWDEQRERARRRDGYRCVNCGIPENGRTHHVHHKIPFRTFSSYQQANVLDNLVTLCPSCHRRAETVVRIRSGLAGLSYALAHLAPISLMCDTGDIGVHSDPQSPLTDGRPTVVIYDRVPAGIGFSERLYELHDDLVVQARDLVSQCECDDGCPSCVGPGGENGYGGKRETIALLEKLSM